MRPALSLVCLTILSACTPLQQKLAQSPHLDTQGPAPDVVILAVSGRCTQPCRAPRDNYDYLSSRGTLDAVARTIFDQGFSVQVAGYADNAAADFQPLKVAGAQRGYAALLSDVAAMQSNWLGKPHPPRLVLLGHSHGAVWLHHFARTHPQIPIALQIDLDANCTSWTLDHGPGLREWKLDTPGQPTAIDACDAIGIPGTVRGVPGKDVVWRNVAEDLEVQSKRLPARSDIGGQWLNYAFDITPNVRPDGSRQGIQTFISTWQDHSTVTYLNTDAMNWVLERVNNIARAWKEEDIHQASPWQP